MEPKKQHIIIITSIGWLLIIGALISLIIYLSAQKNQILNMYKAQLIKTEATISATNQLYRYISLSGGTSPVLVQPKFQYNQDSGLWALVNKSRDIALTYIPAKLIVVPIPKYQNDNTILVRPELSEPLKALYAGAQKDSVNLMVRSAYRSSQDQQALTNSISSSYIAEPGQSEHQTGLAVDFNSSSIYCQTCGLDSASAEWLATHGPEYGFILRYPGDKTTITGYPAETWHYRYVGKTLAQAMQKANLAYEEVYPLFTTAKPRIEK